MRLTQIFEADFSTRKTVWSKRGKEIKRHNVDTRPDNYISDKTTIEIEKQDDIRK